MRKSALEQAIVYMYMQVLHVFSLSQQYCSSNGVVVLVVDVVYTTARVMASNSTSSLHELELYN